MIVKCFKTGFFEVNTYLLIDEKSKEAIIIDLGGDYEKIKKEINKNGVKLKFIINTHGHFDHIMGDKEAQDKDNVAIYMSKKDMYLVNNLETQLSMFNVSGIEKPENINFIDENSKLKIGDYNIKIFETAGHTKGGLSFLIDGKLFAGDTLFYENTGRVDLPGGDWTELKASIKDKLFKLPDDTIVHCGHGNTTTIGHEKEFNEYLK